MLSRDGCLASHAQKPAGVYKPTIPKTWDEGALASLDVPLAEARSSPEHISADEYYRLPVRPIYKSYADYDSAHEPRGYRDWLRQQEPIVLWDDGAHRPKLETEADWIKAGELVFDAPVLFFPALGSSPEESDEFYWKTGDLHDRNGISPFADYVIREKGKGRAWRCILQGVSHTPHARRHGHQRRAGQSPRRADRLPRPC